MLLLLLVAAISFYVIFLYNSVITLKNRTQEAWSDIDVQLKRRYDLIPNLVESVKGYAKHEDSVFQKVTEARAKAMSAQGAAEHAQAENVLKDTLKSLFAVAEAYPELKANTNFLKLQEELSDTENKVEGARRFYNGNVRDFNTKIQSFPNNLIAGQLGFTAFEFFEIQDAAQKDAVKVDFSQPVAAPSQPAVTPAQPATPAQPVAAAPAPEQKPAAPAPTEQPKQ